MRIGKTSYKEILVIFVVFMVGVARGMERDYLAGSADQSTMMELRTQLESDTAFDRDEPFSIRPFNPTLDGRWIGRAVAYGCYREGQAPGQRSPTDAELLEDLQIIAKHWNFIRVYGADEDTRRILELIREHRLPIKVLLGIWLSPEQGNPAEREANIKSTLLGIEFTNEYPDIVLAVSVGNETQVFWSAHRMALDIVRRYVRAVRAHVSVPVTTADDYLYWNRPEATDMAKEVDFIFTHIHPLWNGKTLDSAVVWLDGIYRDLQQTYPGQEIVIGETGWATDIDTTKSGPGEQAALVKGDVGLDAQSAFLIHLHDWIETNRVTTFWFEVFDEPWKGGGDASASHDIEKNWGVYYESRIPKASFTNYLSARKASED